MIHPDGIDYYLCKTIQEHPQISQRDIAAKLGISLGKVNYCLRALIERGWVKAGNFRRSDRKSAYAYYLTPKGMEAKARVAARFLRQKMIEFDSLREEIERLRQETLAGVSARNPAGALSDE